MIRQTDGDSANGVRFELYLLNLFPKSPEGSDSSICRVATLNGIPLELFATPFIELKKRISIVSTSHHDIRKKLFFQ